jgi:hypothetical protein
MGGLAGGLANRMSKANIQNAATPVVKTPNFGFVISENRAL